MRFAISLPDGRQVTPAVYLNALRVAQANPSQPFRESFQDPTGWMGGHTGASIVQEHRKMLERRWSGWHVHNGKGNRAKKRAQELADKRAECKWCGTPTGSARKAFCCPTCARSYNL